MTKLALFKDI